MQLQKFQTRFKDLMLDHPDAVKHLEPDFAGQFEEGNIPLAQRLSVYRNNIVGSLTDIMLGSFPLIEKLVGKEFLEGAARAFILQNPPNQGCLNFYGRGFPEFLESFEPAKALPYLPDMARLEIAMNDSYYAADQEALTADGLAAIPPESLGDLKLELCDHVHVILSRYPLLGIKAMCENPDVEPPDMNEGAALMTFRQDLKTEIAKLGEDEFAVLSYLQSGHALGESVEKVLQDYPDFNVQGFLQKHLALETFLALGTK